MNPLVLGLDLGTSGVRAAVLNATGQLLHTSSTTYTRGLPHAEDWSQACRDLILGIPETLRSQLRAMAVDGTSGTLLACRADGSPIGQALPYFQACPEQSELLRALVPATSPAASNSGSLARALQLLQQIPGENLLRHQADWINGWLLQDWRWGEEGNNLRLGWNPQQGDWDGAIAQQRWAPALPSIKPSGTVLGCINSHLAVELGLSLELMVVAGTTDSNAAVLAADPGEADGVTVLGTTLVMKRFTARPLFAPGITNHRVGGRWLCGGASNAGAGVLRRFFNDSQLRELSRQIDPESSSGLRYVPLPGKGERFPVDDPGLMPVLEPRPVSDALFLHGLFEGLAAIEAQGWKRLEELGAEPPKRVISLGGGARNPQWRRLRERRLGCPVRSCTLPPAAGVARLALQALHKGESAQQHR